MKRKGKKYRMLIEKKTMQITKIGLNLRVELAD